MKMILETERLILREYTYEDFDALYKILSHFSIIAIFVQFAIDSKMVFHTFNIDFNRICLSL